jgi:OmpA-OmpF porin, OOP family
MKKQLFAVVVGAALAFPLFAQAEGAYVGGNIGRAELKAGGDGFGKENKTSFKAYAGYDFTANFGVEGGYVGFGKVKGNDGTESSSGDTSALYAAVTGTLPLNEQFSLLAKVGITRNETKIKIDDTNFHFSSTENKTSALIGVGGAYNINKNLSAVAEYEHFGKTLQLGDSHIKASQFSVGLRYKF